MTGGGFGGCTVTLVKKDAVEAAVQRISTGYKDSHDRNATFYVCSPSQGANIVDIL